MRPSEAREEAAGGLGGCCKPPPPQTGSRGSAPENFEILVPLDARKLVFLRFSKNHEAQF